MFEGINVLKWSWFKVIQFAAFLHMFEPQISSSNPITAPVKATATKRSRGKVASKASSTRLPGGGSSIRSPRRRLSHLKMDELSMAINHLLTSSTQLFWIVYIYIHIYFLAPQHTGPLIAGEPANSHVLLIYIYIDIDIDKINDSWSITMIVDHYLGA